MAVIKIRKEFFTTLIIILCFYFMFRFPLTVKDGITQGIKICFNTVIPSLFPFAVLSSYIVKSDKFRFSAKILTVLARVIFHQPACTIPVILISMTGGFPLGLKGASDLYDEGLITQNQAQRLGFFCINAGPAFVISGVGALMLGNVKSGIIIYISLCISSVLLGIMSSFFSKKGKSSSASEFSEMNRNYSLSDAVGEAIQSLMNICAWIILFSSVASCIRTLNLPDIAYNTVISLLEVTKGCTLLAGKTSVPIIAGIIGFGGICVHFQVMNFLKKIGLKYVYFLVGRIICGLLSALICHCLLIVFPSATEVSSQAVGNSPFVFSVSLPSLFIFLTMCVIMIFDIDRKKII